MSKIEHEVLGEIDKEFFESLKSQFSSEYGNPTIKKRLSISFWDPKISKNVDTRIRITDGRAEIMQKVGEWENKNSLQMKEIDLKLNPSVDEIYTVYLLFYNYSKEEFPPRIIQYENYLFNTSDFEIKLAKQFGKSTKYIFEIEKKGNKSLQKFVKEMGLSKHVLVTDSDFWLKWNKEVNLASDKFSEEELKELIGTYL